MYRGKTIAVVVPAYNEEVLISRVVRLFFWCLKEKYVIRNFHPLGFFYFFYFFGFFMPTLSTFMFVCMILLWVRVGDVPEISFMSWFFSFAIGFNSLGFGMWFDDEENRSLSVPHRRLGQGRA